MTKGKKTLQIGLVDLLTSVGIIPDYIIGHSVGELGCAYADGCFTTEEMILAAYSRGLIQTKVSRISMATVELGYEDIKDLCPPDINVECRNGPDSSIISGPAESMSEFVEKLQVSSRSIGDLSKDNLSIGMIYFPFELAHVIYYSCSTGKQNFCERDIVQQHTL